MRYYLETSAIRGLSNKLKYLKNTNIFTTSLVMFELIAGITEQEFEKRKAVICNVIDSGIKIDWDTYKGKMYKAYQEEYVDEEADAIKTLTYLIYECKSLQEVKERCVKEDIKFWIEDFAEFDKDISITGKYETKIGTVLWQLLNSKKETQNINSTIMKTEDKYPFFRLNMELQIISFSEEMAGEKRPSEKYFDYIKRYDGSLNNYFRFSQIQFSLCQLQGQNTAKNDTIDALHMIYVDDECIIVSDDKIFTRIRNVVDFFLLNTTNQFILEMDLDNKRNKK